jgi:ABC-type multidrug transport system ATPase subunit
MRHDRYQRSAKVVQGNTVVHIDAPDVRAGEIAALVGPAGSGKSTLLDLLTGGRRPTAGTIRLTGIDPDANAIFVGSHTGVVQGIYNQECEVEAAYVDAARAIIR